MGKIESSLYKYSDMYQNIIFLIKECGENDVTKIVLFSVLLNKIKQCEELIKGSISIRKIVNISFLSKEQFFLDLKRSYQIINALLKKGLIAVEDGYISKIDNYLEFDWKLIFRSASFKSRLIDCVKKTNSLSIINEVIRYV